MKTSTASQILLQDVRKTYHIEAQKIDALRGIHLSIPTGSVHAVTGKSGAGKSTLLHVVGLLDRPSSGQIFLGGVEVGSMSDRTASSHRNKGIGFVFQMNNLLAEFTALENIMMPGLIAGLPRGSVKQRALEMLSAVELSKRASHRPGELSGGEQQRVAIARALLMSPPLLLADEPTGNLDQKTSHAIQGLLLQLCNQHNMTMLLVTHDLELAGRLPNRIVMEDGQIVDRGNL